MPSALSNARMLFLGMLLVSGCDKDDISWGLFNAHDDQLEVLVEPVDELGPTIEIDLHSNVDTTAVIGSASIDPSSGRAGTRHLLLVHVGDEWEDVVSRATVLADAGERGVVELELRRDSADHGTFGVELESQGAPQEERMDILTIQLWEAVSGDESSD
jgi:hypothetical protein